MRYTKLAFFCLAIWMLFSVGAARAATLDRSFGNDGTALFRHGGTLDFAGQLDEFAGQPYALAIDSKGRILVGGGSGASFLVLRYLPTGVLDPSFADGGVLKLYDRFETGVGYDDPSFSAPRIKAILPRKDGSITLVGQSFALKSQAGFGNSKDMIFVLNEAGDQDMQFGSVLGVKPGDTPGSMPRSAVYDEKGRLLIAGNRTFSFDDTGTADGYAGLMSRRLADGSYDPSFGAIAGRFSVPSPGTLELKPTRPPAYSAITSVKPLANGKILAAGHHENRFTVMRFLRNGTLDRSFGNKGNRGQTIANFGGKKCFCVAGGDMDTDARGRIVQEGYSTFPSKKRIVTVALVRYLANGKLDRTFGKSGFASSTYKPSVRSTSVAIQRNGKILVAARLGYAENSRAMLMRYLTDGRPDRSFFNRGRYVFAIGDVSTAEKVVIDGHGRAIVAGGASIDGTGSFVLKRFLLSH